MQYRLKVVFVDNSELVLEDTEKHYVSDDLEVLEISTASEVLIVPMRQIKYVSCDARVFKEATGA